MKKPFGATGATGIVTVPIALGSPAHTVKFGVPLSQSICAGEMLQSQSSSPLVQGTGPPESNEPGQPVASVKLRLTAVPSANESENGVLIATESAAPIPVPDTV